MSNVEAAKSKEVRKICVDLCAKFPKTFRGFDPSKVLCLISDRRTKDYARFYAVKHPWDKLNPDYVYILEIIRERWRDLDPARKHMLIFHEMLHVPKGGFDETMKSYKRVKPHDLKDFMLVIAKVVRKKAKDIDWVNSEDIPDILE